MLRTITCSCGSVLQSEDEEELYSLVRGHAARLHPEPRQAGSERVIGSASPGSVAVSPPPPAMQAA